MQQRIIGGAWKHTRFKALLKSSARKSLYHERLHDRWSSSPLLMQSSNGIERLWKTDKIKAQWLENFKVLNHMYWTNWCDWSAWTSSYQLQAWFASRRDRTIALEQMHTKNGTRKKWGYGWDIIDLLISMWYHWSSTIWKEKTLKIEGIQFLSLYIKRDLKTSAITIMGSPCSQLLKFLQEYFSTN